MTTNLNKSFVRSFHAEAEQALQALAEKHGVNVRRTSGSFDSKNATLKFNVSVIDENGTVLTPEGESFKRNALQFGLQPADLFGTFFVNGTQYRITGLKTRRPKFPISAERVSDGRAFKFPLSSVEFVNPVA